MPRPFVKKIINQKKKADIKAVIKEVRNICRGEKIKRKIRLMTMVGRLIMSGKREVLKSMMARVRREEKRKRWKRRLGVRR